MVGAGPQWGSAFSGSTKAGVEIAGDFMFRGRLPDRKLGWFLVADLQLQLYRRP